LGGGHKNWGTKPSYDMKLLNFGLKADAEHQLLAQNSDLLFARGGTLVATCHSVYNRSMPDHILFLKLGGSLITDKDIPYTPRLEVISRLADEIAAARQADPHLRILLGHGSGSFGHTPAKKYDTRRGVSTSEQWLGFAEVWKEARQLNELVLSALIKADLPVMIFSPSAFMLALDGASVPARGEFRPILSALQHGLIPVIHGDVIFDTVRGGTIFSTEDVFSILAPLLRPTRILLSGIEEGVWSDFPACTRLISRITPRNYPDFTRQIQGSVSVDVTGGMLQKVKSMLELAEQLPGLQTVIFSGRKPGYLQQALLGESPGTIVSTD
jgi:isopentenyl phosphate kinase